MSDETNDDIDEPAELDELTEVEGSSEPEAAAELDEPSEVEAATDAPPEMEASPTTASDVAPEPASEGAGTPPGWYPDGSGGQRWWDGGQWTDHTAPAVTGGALSTTDSKTIATLIHIGGIFFGFIPALILYLVKADDPYVKHHAAQALNLEITLIIAYVASFILIFVLIGLLLIPIVFIASLVLHIQAAIAANRGEYFRIPLTLQLIS